MTVCKKGVSPFSGGLTFFKWKPTDFALSSLSDSRNEGLNLNFGSCSGRAQVEFEYEFSLVATSDRPPEPHLRAPRRGSFKPAAESTAMRQTKAKRVSCTRATSPKRESIKGARRNSQDEEAGVVEMRFVGEEKLHRLRRYTRPRCRTPGRSASRPPFALLSF